jgi:type IV secretion system protein VirD4
MVVQPVYVTCLLDEFANQKISNFQHLISVVRSREISAHIIVQTQSQLKAGYKDHAETIIGNCSCVLFLGGKERSTLKEISETLGKETIDICNESETRSNQKSYGLNYQKLGKDMPYLFVKSWLPKTKINRTGTRSASNSANHVCCINSYLT